MTKGWTALSWGMIAIGQVAVGYGLAYLGNVWANQPNPQTIAQFLLIPLGIWLGYTTGVYAIGMLGLGLKKVKPRAAGLRLFTTATLASVPMLMLIFNAVTVGPENQQQFQGIVVGRMVPYYTQLCAAFALVGFYVTLWWHRVAAAQEAAKSAVQGKKGSKPVPRK